MTTFQERIAWIRTWFPSLDHFWLFLRIAAWSAVLPLLLPFLSLPTLLLILTPDPLGRLTGPEALAVAELIDRYIGKVLRENPDNRGRLCLRRSLLLYRFLRSFGLPVHFFVGVRKENGGLSGHSWIELEGRHFKDTQAEVAYAVTFSYTGEED